MKHVIAALSLAAALPAYAASYPNIDAAARAAVAEAMATPSTACVEFAGVILAHGDAVTYSAPQAGARDKFEVRVKLQAGDKLVAIYHTHPSCSGAEFSTLFSSDDVDTARALRVPSYIGVLADNSVRRFDPLHDSTQKAQGLGRGRIAYGVVLK